MRIGRPRTLLGLILMGLGLLTLPLLVGVGNAALKLGQLADESAAVVSASVTATLQNQRIARLLTDMERNGLRYLVILDPQTLTFYETDNTSLQEGLAILEGLPKTDAIDTEIEILRKTSAAVMGALLGGPSALAESQVTDGFRRMNSSSGTIATGMSVLISERLNALDES
ncbi:MAG TPA: hypothetical protein VIM81_05260, partial [Gammaproteobacteria bacterium]